MKSASNWLGGFPARRGPLELEAVPPPPLLRGDTPVSERGVGEIDRVRLMCILRAFR